MGAKVFCKKGYNTKDAFVEFKQEKDLERCPVSDARYCAECKIKKLEDEEE